MVGRRYNLHDTGRWDDELPGSEVVVIGNRGGIDDDAMTRRFDDCVGTGDEDASSTLRISRRIGLAS